MAFVLGEFRRFLVPLVVLASFLFASSSTAEVPPAPVWLAQDGYSFNLVSNKGWRAVGAGGGTAREVYLWGKGNPNASTGYERQDKAYIWAPTCTDARQEFKFKRSFFLPGPAKTFGARLDPAFYGSIVSVRVYINGIFAFGDDDGYKFVPRAANRYARLLRFGANDIEIQVVKRAKSKYEGFCLKGTPAKRLGLDFDLYGEFESNVSIAKGFKGGNTHVYFGIEEGDNLLIVAVQNRYRAMINLGPSGAYDSIFQINVSSGPSTEELEVGKLSTQGLTNCQETSLNQRHWLLKCDIARWAPNAKVGADFNMHITLVDGSKKYDVIGDAQLYPKTSDPVSANNRDLWQMTFCRPDASDPKCPAPLELSRASP